MVSGSSVHTSDRVQTWPAVQLQPLALSSRDFLPGILARSAPRFRSGSDSLSASSPASVFQPLEVPHADPEAHDCHDNAEQQQARREPAGDLRRLGAR
jgi:hypothetical protein